MKRSETVQWLRQPDEQRLEELWRRAESVRRENVGEAVHLRGLIEFSNYCVRQCAYCGLRASNRRVERYRMTEHEILEGARQAVRFGYGTAVLQSGEDYGVRTEWLAAVVRRIKAETSLAVTLSVGERPDEDLVAWREAGADRYLLRFETSNEALYERIHPRLPLDTPRPPASDRFAMQTEGGESRMPVRRSDRIAMLRRLKALGYETGSGVMIGIPGQTYDDLANDIGLFRELDLDMIGCGPFIPHPGTPLGQAEVEPAAPGEQVPNTELMTYKVVALSRIACPRANIPSTTALATLNLAQGRELGLMRGANVVMPNLTPPAYRCKYEIYPAKACMYESAGDCHNCIKQRILAIGRTIGTGRGDSPKGSTAATIE